MMVLSEVPAKGPGGQTLIGAGTARCIWGCWPQPETRELMSGGLEIGLPRDVAEQLAPGDVICTGPSGENSMRLLDRLGRWNDFSDLVGFTARWATDGEGDPPAAPMTIREQADWSARHFA